MNLPIKKIVFIGAVSLINNQIFSNEAKQPFISVNTTQQERPENSCRCKIGSGTGCALFMSCLALMIFIPLGCGSSSIESVGNKLNTLPKDTNLNTTKFQVNYISCGNCIHNDFLLPIAKRKVINPMNLTVAEAFKKIDEVCIIPGTTTLTDPGCFRKSKQYAALIGQAPEDSQGTDFAVWLKQLAEDCGAKPNNSTAAARETLKRGIAGQRDEVRSIKERLKIGKAKEKR